MALHKHVVSEPQGPRPVAQEGGWKRRDAATGCDGDGVVIGVAKASSTSRGGLYVRQEGMVISVEKTSSTSREEAAV